MRRALPLVLFAVLTAGARPVPAHHPSLRRVTGLLAVTALSGLISGAILGVLTTVLR